MNRKGSILLSLLAVILLLGIILFFIFGNGNNEENSNDQTTLEETIDSSVGGANVSSIYAYISSVEFEIAKGLLYNSEFVGGKYSVLEIDDMYTLSIRSEKPSEGNMCISNDGIVTKGSFKLNHYVISYDGKNAEVIESTSIQDIDCLD